MTKKNVRRCRRKRSPGSLTSVSNIAESVFFNKSTPGIKDDQENNALAKPLKLDKVLQNRRSHKLAVQLSNSLNSTCMNIVESKHTSATPLTLRLPMNAEKVNKRNGWNNWFDHVLTNTSQMRHPNLFRESFLNQRHPR